MLRLVALVFASLVLVGCGGSSGSAPDSKADSSGVPQCSDVWQDGKTLPDDYEGCVEGGAIEAAVARDCDGWSLVSYESEARSFWTTPGMKIVAGGADMLANPDYVAASEACSSSK